MQYKNKQKTIFDHFCTRISYLLGYSQFLHFITPSLPHSLSHLSLSQSLHLSISSSLNLFISPSLISPSLNLFISPSLISPSLHLTLSSSHPLFISPSLHLTLSSSHPLFISPSLPLSSLPLSRHSLSPVRLNSGKIGSPF